MQPQPLIGVLISSFKSLHYFPLLNTFPKCECFTDIFTGLGNFILLNSHSVCKVGFLFMKKGWSWGLKRFNNLLILLLNGPSWDLYLSLSTSKVYYILLKRFIYVREGGGGRGRDRIFQQTLCWAWEPVKAYYLYHPGRQTDLDSRLHSQLKSNSTVLWCSFAVYIWYQCLIAAITVMQLCSIHVVSVSHCCCNRWSQRQ